MTRHPTDRGTVLLVDDDRAFLQSSKLILRSVGLENVLTVDDSRQALPLIESTRPSLIILDLKMPHITGCELLKSIREQYPAIPVIILTASDELERAVECMRSGAIDYLVKPVERSRFVSSVMRSLEIQDLRHEITHLSKRILSPEPTDRRAFSSIVTKSRKMFAIFNYVEVVAASNQPVLITGETGVGKELIARAIHDVKEQKKGNFVALNVAGLDDNMFSDTLFGHERGAYTGAEKKREGFIAKAAGGTLFLDEIGDLETASQVKLLRLLQDGEYYPIGSDLPRKADARIIAATHQDLEGLVASGHFRNDLFYRLHFHHIHIPPLRERPEDLPLLLEHFLEKCSASMNRKKPAAPRELLALMESYHFPGNVRELNAMVCDAVVRHKSGILSMAVFKDSMKDCHPSPGGARHPLEMRDAPFVIHDRFPTLKVAEEYLIAEALERSGNKQGIAADLLGISRQALNKRISRRKKGN